MLPILLEIGPFPIHSYGLMIAIGFLTALFFIQRDAKAAGFDPKAFSDLSFYAFFIGIIGARLAHIVMFPYSYSWSDPIGWIAIWRGGLVFQGGPLLAMIFVFYYLRRQKISFWAACDIMFPYLALAHGFGRMGCFLNGCCYGKPTSVPWAIPARRVPWDTTLPPTGSSAYLDHLHRYSDIAADAHWSHAIHPTQLYSFLGLLLICLTLLYLRKHWHPFSGFTLPIYFVVYGFFRFLVEFFRGDHNPTHFFSLTDQQVASALFAAVGVALFFVLRRWLGEREAAT